MFFRAVAVCALGLSPLLATNAYAFCGDGYLERAEDCDDGNNARGDGCSGSCTVEPGWDCEKILFELDGAEEWESGIPDTDYPPPDWVISGDRRSLSQKVNSDPGIFVSTMDATAAVFEVDVTVDTDFDNDFVGVALGIEAGDGTRSSADYLLLSWKQGYQDDPDYGEALAGMALLRINGITDAVQLWQHKGPGTTELARAKTLGATGWADYQTYRLKVDYSRTRVVIWVDGVEQFNETGTFPAGNFGLYNFSQQDVFFDLVSPVNESACNPLDTDGDTIWDYLEDVNRNGNLEDDDTDGDGRPNYDDPDDDGDDVPTAFETYDGSGNPLTQDSDGDRIPDYLDDDDDNDGVPTKRESYDRDSDPIDDDTDGDGTPDYLDIDDDGDGLDTRDEVYDGLTDPTAQDTDGDGTPDYIDDDDDDDTILTRDEVYDGVRDPRLQDSDGDGTPDYRDDDDDDDQVPTADEAYGGTTDPRLQDTDGNGMPDYRDIDDDGDSLTTVQEDLDLNGDPRNDDTDGDGTPNYLDVDDDDDGIPSIDEDANNNGDLTDDDTDGDGIVDYLDPYDDRVPDVVAGRYAGGALSCSTAGGSGTAPWLLLLGLLLVRRRQR